MFTISKKGFTLIELLVVISIISLLSTIVFASLNIARAKARIAAAQRFATHLSRAFGADAVASYNFESVVGATVKDMSESGRDLTLVGNPQLGPGVSGGQALSLNGSTQNAYAPAIPLTLNAFTFTAWVYPTVTPAIGSVGVISHIDTSAYPYIGMRKLSTVNPLHFIVRFDGNVAGTSFSENYCPTVKLLVKLNEWQHIAFSSNGTEFAIYLDGQEVCRATRTTPPINFSPNGNTVGSASLHYGGYIDDVNIFSQSVF